MQDKECMCDDCRRNNKEAYHDGNIKDGALSVMGIPAKDITIVGTGDGGNMLDVLGVRSPKEAHIRIRFEHSSKKMFLDCDPNQFISAFKGLCEQLNKVVSVDVGFKKGKSLKRYLDDAAGISKSKGIVNTAHTVFWQPDQYTFAGVRKG